MDDASEMEASIFDWAIIMLSKLIQCDCLSQLRMWYTFNVKKSILDLILVIQIIMLIIVLSVYSRPFYTQKYVGV